MQSNSFPAKFPIPFANGAGGAYIRQIPTASQTATSADAPASLTDGFPPPTFTPVAGGGVPPSGKDFNGILNQLTAWARLHACGVFFAFDGSFASAIGGYPLGAIVASTTAGVYWLSTAENNTTNPDASGASGWTIFLPAKASVAETQAGSDDTKYVTPHDIAGAGFIRVVSSNIIANGGYRKWSDGYTEHWGQINPNKTTETTFTLTFPRAFDTACFGVKFTTINSGASNDGDTTAQEVSLTRTGGTFYNQSDEGGHSHDSSGGFRWFAWGN